MSAESDPWIIQENNGIYIGIYPSLLHAKLNSHQSTFAVYFKVEICNKTTNPIPAGMTLTFEKSNYFLEYKLKIEQKIAIAESVTFEIDLRAGGHNAEPEEISWNLARAEGDPPIKSGSIMIGSEKFAPEFLDPSGDIDPQEWGNCLVFGMMGSGKSSLLNTLLTSMTTSPSPLSHLVAMKMADHVTTRYQKFTFDDYQEIMFTGEQRFPIHFWDSWGLNFATYTRFLFPAFLKGFLRDGTKMQKDAEKYLVPDEKRRIHAILFVMTAGQRYFDSVVSLLQQYIMTAVQEGYTPMLVVTHIDLEEDYDPESRKFLIDELCAKFGMAADAIFLFQNYTEEKGRSKNIDRNSLYLLRQIRRSIHEFKIRQHLSEVKMPPIARSEPRILHQYPEQTHKQEWAAVEALVQTKNTELEREKNARLKAEQRLEELKARLKGGPTLQSVIDQKFTATTLQSGNLEDIPFLHLCSFPLFSLQLLFRSPLTSNQAKSLKAQLLFSPFLIPLQSNAIASQLWNHIQQFCDILSPNSASESLFIILAEIELFLRSLQSLVQTDSIVFDQCAIATILAEFGIGVTQQQHIFRLGLNFQSIYAEFVDSYFSDCGVSHFILPALRYRLCTLGVLRRFVGQSMDILHPQAISLQPSIIQELMDAQLTPDNLFSRLQYSTCPQLHQELSLESIDSLKQNLALAWMMLEYRIPWSQQSAPTTANIFDPILPIQSFNSDIMTPQYLLRLFPSLSTIENAARLKQSIVLLQKELPLLHHDRKLLPMQINPEHIELDALPPGPSGSDPNQLGEGLAGEVRKGTFLKGRVAIKLIAAAHEFEKEVVAWLHLRHTHLVTLYGVVFPSPAESRYQIVMELLDCDLRTLVYPVKQLDQATMIDVARQIVVGLNYIHARGSIHRDLKCKNILVKRSWDANTQREHFQIKIGDFGVTRPLNAQGNADTLRLLAGTPGWMAPELFLNEIDSATNKIDIYAYAIVLFEIFGYFTEFDYDQRLVNLDMMRHQIIRLKQREQRPVDCPSMTDDVWNLITYCWQTNPDLRPSTTSILRDSLFSYQLKFLMQSCFLSTEP